MTTPNTLFKLVLASAKGPEEEFVLAGGVVSLGRDSSNDVIIGSNPGVSRFHARLECSETGCTIEDLGSPNGTRVNGQLIQKTSLKPGDIVALGSASLTFNIAEQADDATLPQQESGSVADNSIAMQLQNNMLPRLVTRTAEATWETILSGDALAIGRARENDLVISLPNISRRHARVVRKKTGFILQDLNSENGTWMGRFRVCEAELHHGDSFRIGGAQIIFKHSFSPEELIASNTSDLRHALLPVVFVPGFAGSKLWLGKEQVWPRLGQLVGNRDVLKYQPETPIKAHDLVDQVVIIPGLLKQEQYSRLSDYLQEGLSYEREKSLLEFAYDFRQDIRLSARSLAAAVEKWRVPRPITIIAHSMGCLVSRYYIDCLGGHKHVGRLILMGGPHEGVPKAVVTLFLGPKLLPFGWLDSQMRDLIVTFPSTYQLLPAYTCVADSCGEQIDLFADDSWLPVHQRSLLSCGKELRQELLESPRVPSVCIFGYGMKTITGVTMSRSSDGTCSVQPIIESRGDSTVPERSAMLPGCEIHPVRQYHGALFVDNDVKMRLKIELMRASARAK